MYFCEFKYSCGRWWHFKLVIFKIYRHKTFWLHEKTQVTICHKALGDAHNVWGNKRNFLKDFLCQTVT